MKIKSEWFFVAYLLLSYPLNFAMMYNNVGLYDTPTKTWLEPMEQRRQKAEDAQSRRTLCLAVSPLSAPISGLFFVTEVTIPEEY